MERNKYEDGDILIELRTGVIYASFKKGTIVTRSVSEKSIRERIRLSNGISYPVLADTRNVKYWTMDSRNNDMKDNAFDLIDFTAVVISSKTIKIIWDFAVKLFPMPVESKIFNDFEAADLWIRKKTAKKHS